MLLQRRRADIGNAARVIISPEEDLVSQFPPAWQALGESNPSSQIENLMS